MTTIACPICAGPVELTGETPNCLIGHHFDPDDLQAQVQREAAQALWSAVRALEDTASGARWRMTLPSPPASLQEAVERAEQEAELLRDLISRREGADSDTSHRPEKW